MHALPKNAAKPFAMYARDAGNAGAAYVKDTALAMGATIDEVSDGFNIDAPDGRVWADGESKAIVVLHRDTSTDYASVLERMAAGFTDCPHEGCDCESHD